MAGPGNGATFTGLYGTKAFTATIISGQGPEFSRPKINDTNLGTLYSEQYIPGAIADPGEFSAVIEWLPNDTNAVDHFSLNAAGSSTAGPIVLRPSVSAVLTFPFATATTTKATLTGTGFVTKFSFPQLGSNSKMTAGITFAYDGKTAPVFTREV